MNDSNKTVADALKELEAKTADKSEVIPLLKSIERNTAKGVASAVGVEVGKAVAKANGRVERRQKTSVAGKKQQQASAAIVASSKNSNIKYATGTRGVKPKAPSSSNAQATAMGVRSARDNAGRFTAKKQTATKDVAADQKQEAQNDKLFSILKDAVMGKKETLKETALRLMMGPFYDIGKEMKEAADSMKDTAKDEKSTAGRLKAWGKNTRVGKAFGSAKEKAAEKYRSIRAARGGAAATAAGTTTVNNGGGGPGVLDRAQQIKDLRDGWKSRKSVKVSRPAAAGRGAAGGVRAGGGAMARGAGMLGSAGSAIGRMIGPLVSGISLPLVAAAGAAAFGLWQFGKALTTGESDINNWFKKITGLDAGKETQRDRDKAAAKDQQNLDQLNKDRASKGLSEVDSKGQYKTKGDVVFANGNTTTVRNADGSLTERKGARAARNNNAGNMEYGDVAKSYGAVGSDGRFAVFPDKATGDKAKEKLFFEGKNYKNKTLAEATARWAPSNENDTAKYTQVLTKAAGGENKKMFEYTPEQRKAIMAAMEKHEGNKLTSTRTIPASEAEAYLASKGKASTAPAQAATPASGSGAGTAIGGALNNTGNPSVKSAEPPKTATASPPKPKRKPLTASGQKASAAGPATAEVVANAPESKPVVAAAPASGKAEAQVIKSGSIKAGSVPTAMGTVDYGAKAKAMLDKENQPETAAPGTPATAMGTVGKKDQPAAPVFGEEQAKAEYAKTVSEKDAAMGTHWAKYHPMIKAAEDSGNMEEAKRLSKEANAGQGDIWAEYNKKTDATRAKEAAAKEAESKPEAPQVQAKANAEAPAPPPADPSKAMGTVGAAATDSGKQYGAGDIFSERKRIDEESKSKKAKLLSDFRSGKTTEDEYVKAAAEEDKARNEKKASLAELSKKTEGGQFVSQAEMDKATGKVSAQPDKVNALSSAPPPLPEVQPVQAPPPPPVEVPGLEKLAKANEQQAAQQNSGADKGGGKQGIPNIKTDFDDTMLVLMSYDRI